MNTEPNIPIVDLARNIEAIGDYAALLTVMTEEPLFPRSYPPEAYEEVIDFPTLGPIWGDGRRRPLDDLMRQALVGSRLMVRVARLNYSNPLETVIAVSEGASLLVKFANILQTVASGGATKRAELLAAQLDSFVREATLEFEVDRVTAEALKTEAEYESASTQARRDLIMMALEIIRAQTKARDDGIAVPLWTFEQTVSFLSQDPQIVEQIRTFQSNGVQVHAVGPEATA